MWPSPRRRRRDAGRPWARLLAVALAAWAHGEAPARFTSRADAAVAKAGPAAVPGLRVLSVRALPASTFEPLASFSADGALLWLAGFEDGHLRLTARGPEGNVVHEATADLALRQPPYGIVATPKGPIVFGDSSSPHPESGGGRRGAIGRDTPSKEGSAPHDAWLAYLQPFDGQGAPSPPRIFRGLVGVRSVAASDDGGLSLMLHVHGTVSIGSTAVTGPTADSQQPPAIAVLHLGATGMLEWSRMLAPDSERRDPRLLGAADGRLALLWSSPDGLWGVSPASKAGGGAELWSREGKTTWTSSRLSSVSSAAFDSNGRLWALGIATPTGPPPKVLPVLALPQVLDHGTTAAGRRALCKGCLFRPQLGADRKGDVVLLAAVTGRFQVDGVTFPVDAVTSESWALLQLHEGHLRAHHVLRTTRAWLSVGSNGRVAVVATGVRGQTSLDGKVVGARNQTVVLQFDR